MVLGGSQKLSLLPLGDKTKVKLSSDWASPSFHGAYLPTTRRVGQAGFSAEWRILNLGRTYAAHWQGASVSEEELSSSMFGLELYTPIDVYQRSNRAGKYGVLFIGLTFLVYFMFEIFTRLLVHPLQYVLVGFAICLFYMLLLSLSEHFGFHLAYVASAIVSIGLITGYSASVLRARSRALVVGGVLSALYAFLYIVLQAENFAMLMGSLMLFVTLALVMYLTRNIDWYRISLASDVQPEAG